MYYSMVKTTNIKNILVKCKSRKNGKILYAPVCPGCWNSKTGRAFLTSKLNSMKIEVLNTNDKIEGLYVINSNHVNECTYKNLFN